MIEFWFVINVGNGLRAIYVFVYFWWHILDKQVFVHVVGVVLTIMFVSFAIPF